MLYGSVSDPREQLTSCEKLNIASFPREFISVLTRRFYFPQSRPGFSEHSARLSTASFKVQNQTLRTEIETVTDLRSGRSSWGRGRVPGEPTASSRRAGEARRTPPRWPKQPVAAAARRFTSAPWPPWPCEVRTAARAARPRVLLRVRVPAPERARGAGPRGLGGRERGTRGEGRAAGPARQGTWAPPVRPTGHFPFTPGGCRAPCCRLETAGRVSLPRRGAQARSCLPAGQRAGPRGRARPRAGVALPPPRPRPQRAAAARWRLSPRARRPPAPGGFSLAKLRGRLEGASRQSPVPAPPPPLQAAAREGPAGSPAFLPAGSFRALALSIARFSPLALVFFLSFLLFVRPRGRFFRSRRLRSPARALLPAGLRGAGRQAALPAPLHPRSGGGGGRGAPHSDSFQYGTGAGRMRPRPPPPSALLPAAGAPRAARVAPPGPASPSPPARLPAPRDLCRRRGDCRLKSWGSRATRRRRPACSSPQLALDTPWAVAQGTRWRLPPPTALQPGALGPRRRNAPPRTQRPRCPCSDPRGKGPLTSPRVGWNPGNQVASRCRFWRSGRGEARCCRPHVTASGKMALAQERTERRPEPS